LKVRSGFELRDEWKRPMRRHEGIMYRNIVTAGASHPQD
jgi:hypothetical protein